MIGASLGFSLWISAGLISRGSRPAACDTALWTSCAAASTFRSSENCSTIRVEPVLLVELIVSSPCRPLNCRSSGVATAAAIVSGLAPGSDMLTVMVGKSTVGSSLTGKVKKAIPPNSTSAIMTTDVITARRMNNAERFTRAAPRRGPLRCPAAGLHGPRSRHAIRWERSG